MTVLQQTTPPPSDEPEPKGFLARYLSLQKAEGILAPLITAVLAFLIGGVVVFATTKNVPDVLQTYRAIFEGAGLDWFLPWNTCRDPCAPRSRIPARAARRHRRQQGSSSATRSRSRRAGCSRRS